MYGKVTCHYYGRGHSLRPVHPIECYLLAFTQLVTPDPPFFASGTPEGSCIGEYFICKLLRHAESRCQFRGSVRFLSYIGSNNVGSFQLGQYHNVPCPLRPPVPSGCSRPIGFYPAPFDSSILPFDASESVHVILEFPPSFLEMRTITSGSLILFGSSSVALVQSEFRERGRWFSSIHHAC